MRRWTCLHVQRRMGGRNLAHAARFALQRIHPPMQRLQWGKRAGSQPAGNSAISFLSPHQQRLPATMNTVSTGELPLLQGCRLDPKSLRSKDFCPTAHPPAHPPTHPDVSLQLLAGRLPLGQLAGLQGVFAGRTEHLKALCPDWPLVQGKQAQLARPAGEPPPPLGPTWLRTCCAQAAHRLLCKCGMPLPHAPLAPEQASRPSERASPRHLQCALSL